MGGAAEVAPPPPIAEIYAEDVKTFFLWFSLDLLDVERREDPFFGFHLISSGKLDVE